jgi:hypothetical protein
MAGFEGGLGKGKEGNGMRLGVAGKVRVGERMGICADWLNLRALCLLSPIYKCIS